MKLTLWLNCRYVASCHVAQCHVTWASPSQLCFCLSVQDGRPASSACHHHGSRLLPCFVLLFQLCFWFLLQMLFFFFYSNNILTWCGEMLHLLGLCLRLRLDYIIFFFNYFNHPSFILEKVYFLFIYMQNLWAQLVLWSPLPRAGDTGFVHCTSSTRWAGNSNSGQFKGTRTLWEPRSLLCSPQSKKEFRRQRTFYLWTWRTKGTKWKTRGDQKNQKHYSHRPRILHCVLYFLVCINPLSVPFSMQSKGRQWRRKNRSGAGWNRHWRWTWHPAAHDCVQH